MVSIRSSAVTAILLAAQLALAPANALAAADQEFLDALEWRLIGPYRGGRVTTVTGVVNDPLTYYMGATGGGVWKTANAGLTWSNVSDGFFKVGTIGAVAVAESDSNVIYAGTGESPIRGVTTSHGDGVYRSNDAGVTWQHIGLPKSGQISRIRIHPTNPDLAYVAVQGQIWGPNKERGVFRTTDGGETWQHVLEVGPMTGASDLAMDPTNPRILYAAMWNHGRRPWYVHSGGTDGGIFKSTDGGDSWEKLEGGLPEMIGKIGVDVSASNPQRVYAIVEGEENKGGLYRSDDAGKTWKLLNKTRIIWSRAWYYIHITADPVDEDTVWVLNVPLMKSVDGGKTFEIVKAPHGDHHDLWINPNNNRNMINGNDGGATVTFDGGKTWSSIMNQPTAQFYRVITDNQSPYLVYGGQQDNSTVAIASETLDGGIGHEDYFAVGGGESAHIAFDENDPRLIYATTINGTITEYDHDTQRVRPIKPYPENVYGWDPKDLKYRANWNSPVITSPHDPSVIYYGAQLLLKSTDRGVNWTEISPDLTRNDISHLGTNGGPLTNESVGAEFYHTIFYIAESPHEQGTIWVGADDGMLHLTRNGGGDWSNVSPPHRGDAMINAIELSPHDPATAYLAVTAYKLNDFRPFIYKTDDYGDSWERIDDGLPEDMFVRVVREDPQQQGLLYAGTENAIFVSFDDGDDWQSLQGNLPVVPVTDLRVRHDDLVAATQGRSYWVLDDLSLVRQMARASNDEALSVFAAPEVPKLRSSRAARSGEGDNPAYGATFRYFIRDDHDGPLTIEIRNREGQLVRSYSSEESEFERCIVANMDQRLPFEVKYPPTGQGMNKWTWDLKRNGLECIEDVAMFSGFSGPSAAAGAYTATFRIGDASASVDFSVIDDPRIEATAEEREFHQQKIDEIATLFNTVIVQLGAARRARAQVESLLEVYPDSDDLKRLAEPAMARLQAWDEAVTQKMHETYEDEDSWPNLLDAQIRYLMDSIDRGGPPVTAGSMMRLDDLRAEWSIRDEEMQAIVDEYIADINDWARARGVTHVTVPGL
ncbi:MAG: glycosyl hydrolase [Gammaproteobacteria bacterium]|nr:glycosyl hydrolase [Gammaproteobacteria bacterium]